jgi:hypothetical protein
MIRFAHGLSATALHDRLAARGVRTVLNRGTDGQPRVNFLVTAMHTPDEIDAAVSAVGVVRSTTYIQTHPEGVSP